MNTSSNTSLNTPRSKISLISRVEQRGIEPVPENQRTGNAGQLFWVWFAANISILGIPLGATLIALGLNLWQSLIVAVIGSFGSFAVVGIISIAGQRGGAPSLTLSRRAFGMWGNIGPTLVSLLSRLGWETVNTVTGALTLLSLSAIVFHTSSVAQDIPVLTVICVLIFVALTVLISATGHSFILSVQKWATWIFGALTIAVGIYLVTTVDWSVVLSAPAGSISAVIVGIGTIAAGTGIGWANSGADMARYQKLSVRPAHLIASAACGAGIPLVIVIGVGSILSAGQSSLTQASDPIAAVRTALPDWVAIPYLIAAFAGLLMSNNLSVYSAGLTTITLGIRVPRPVPVLLDVVVTTFGALYFMLGSDSFYGPFISFISLLAVPLTAWIGIFLVDMLSHVPYDAEALLDFSPGSRYFYHFGINWGALVSWLCGLTVGYLFVTAQISADTVWFSGILSDTWVGKNGMAWLVSLLVAGILYKLSHLVSRK